MYKQMYRASVVIEWVAALLFSFYITSFAVDFMAVPAEGQDRHTVFMVSKIWDEEIGIKPLKRIHLFKERGYVGLA